MSLSVIRQGLANIFVQFISILVMNIVYLDISSIKFTSKILFLSIHIFLFLNS